MTHLEETIPKTSFQSNSIPSRMGDIGKGHHEAPTPDPGDGEVQGRGPGTQARSHHPAQPLVLQTGTLQPRRGLWEKNRSEFVSY